MMISASPAMTAVPARPDAIFDNPTPIFEARHEAGLLQEAFDGAGFAGQFVRQEFQGDRPAQEGILRLEDAAHGSAAQGGADSVV